MTTETSTTNRSYPLPYPSNLLAADVLRLRAALEAIDADMANRPEAAAVTAEINAAVQALISGAPGALDTLNELAAALGDDANFAGTVANQLSALADSAAAAQAAADAAQGTADAAMPTTGGTFTGDISVPSLNGGPLAGMRNLLINGNPLINQRGYVAGTATTEANQYTLDRWRVVVSGQSLTWTDSNNVRTVSAPAGGVEQVIEGANIIAGTYTLSWAGSAAATVNGSAVANGAQVTLPGGANATVRFSGGTFALAQLEPGSLSTPFERRTFGQELTLCQRYYESQPEETSIGFACPNTGGFAHRFMFPFKTQKRVAPVVAYNVNNALNVTSHVLTGSNTYAWSFQLVGTSSTNTSATVNFTASAEL